MGSPIHTRFPLVAPKSTTLRNPVSKHTPLFFTYLLYRFGAILWRPTLVLVASKNKKMNKIVIKMFMNDSKNVL